MKQHTLNKKAATAISAIISVIPLVLAVLAIVWNDKISRMSFPRKAVFLKTGWPVIFPYAVFIVCYSVTWALEKFQHKFKLLWVLSPAVAAGLLAWIHNSYYCLMEDGLKSYNTPFAIPCMAASVFVVIGVVWALRKGIGYIHRKLQEASEPKSTDNI